MHVLYLLRKEKEYVYIDDTRDITMHSQQKANYQVNNMSKTCAKT